MTDMELAEEIEQRRDSEAREYAQLALSYSQWQQIIAALRRGPLEEWSQEVRLIVRGIDAQAERITKREQTTWRDGENQAPDEDSDFEDVVIGYKLNTGLWHRLLGLLASCPANERPPSGEMVIVPKLETEAMQDSVRGILQAIRCNPGVTEDQVYQHCKLRGDSTKGLHENDGSYVTEARAAAMIYRAMLAAAEAERGKM